MRFGIKFHWKPTPVKIKHAADAINGALGASGLISVLSDHPKTAVALAACGFVLKAVSNLFAKDDSTNEDNLTHNKS